jgi:hypothetical protein
MDRSQLRRNWYVLNDGARTLDALFGRGRSVVKPRCKIFLETANRRACMGEHEK